MFRGDRASQSHSAIAHRSSESAGSGAMGELYLHELRYKLGEDPNPWIQKMRRVQQVFGYDDAKMVLLVELCAQKPANDFVRRFRHSSSIKEVYDGFRKLHELCQRVSDTEKAFKWALLHVRCKGKHNLRNASLPRTDIPPSTQSGSSPPEPVDEAVEEILTTGEADVLRFPENSFPIPCGHGDFCVNDVLKFDQILLYNNMSLKEGTVGKAYKRTVVGRVAHEAEGVDVAVSTRHSAARMSESFSQPDEEPTYTIEVYWSRGVKPVATSEPFVVKAHSLALLKPVRQRWGNEKNREHEMEKKHNKTAKPSRAPHTSRR